MDRIDRKVAVIDKQMAASRDLIRAGIKLVAKQGERINALISAHERAERRMDRMDERMDYSQRLIDQLTASQLKTDQALKQFLRGSKSPNGR